MANDFPLQPVMTGGPSAPIEGNTASAPAPGAHEGGIADTFKTDYYQSPFVTPIVRGMGELQDPTPISHDDAAKMLKAQGLDPSFLSKDGNTLGAVRAEAERQSEIKLHQLRQDRAGNNWSTSPWTQVGGMVAAGTADPVNLVLGPAAGKLGGMATRAGAGFGERFAIGAGVGGTYVGGSSALSDYENGRDPDLNSWQFLRDTTIGAGTGGLLHATFGPRAIGRPGEKLTTDQVVQLENSTAYAKAHGMDPNDVISPTGAVGLHQIEPATARGLGLKGTDDEITEQLKDPAVNRQMASDLLDQLARRYGNDPEAIAVAYNAGPKYADKWLANGRDDRVIPGQTRAYLGRLRGTSLEARKATGATALQQFVADNDVDPGQAFTKRSALTIDDEHDEWRQNVFSDAMQRAQPNPLRRDLPDGMEDTLSRVRDQAAAVNTTAETENPVNDLAAQAEMLREGAGDRIKDAATEAANEHIEGTQMTHDEVTKAVQAAVQCGVAKGMSYGVE